MSSFHTTLASRRCHCPAFSRDLAALYTLQSRYGEAEQRYLTALSMFESTLGESNPRVRETLLEYSDLLVMMGRKAEAKQLRARAASLEKSR